MNYYHVEHTYVVACSAFIRAESEEDARDIVENEDSDTDNYRFVSGDAYQTSLDKTCKIIDIYRCEDEEIEDAKREFR